MRKTIVMAIVALMVLGLAAPAALAKAEHTDFYGLYFPAGMEETGTKCPYTWVDPAFCVMDMGSWTELPSGRLRIRDMKIFELAFSYTVNDVGDEVVEPRKTGYDIVVANANLDETLSGPTWGTWNLYSFEDKLMFTGTFTGKFEDGIPAVHFVGQGTGSYEGQKMRGDVGRVPDPYNMFGEIIEPGAS
jgi:hypothetical protein